MTYSKSSNRERTYSKSSKRERGGIQNPARERDDVLKIQQEREEVFKIQQEREREVFKIQQERERSPYPILMAASRSCAARRILQRSRRTAPTPASLRRRRNTLARVMSPSKETEVKMPSLIPVVQNYHVDEEEEEGEYWDLWDEDTLFFGYDFFISCCGLREREREKKRE